MNGMIFPLLGFVFCICRSLMMLFPSSREFPLTWMKRHLEKSNFKVLKSKNFTILHSEESVGRQIRVARSKLPLMPDCVRLGMDAYLSDLQ